MWQARLNPFSEQPMRGRWRREMGDGSPAAAGMANAFVPCSEMEAKFRCLRS